MATKKQKRIAGEARQKIYREASIRSGLEAQRKDRERREANMKKAEAEAQKRNASRIINGMAPATTNN